MGLDTVDNHCMQVVEGPVTHLQTTILDEYISSDQLLLDWSSSVCPSVCSKQNSGLGDTAKTTGPIYFGIFFHGYIILSR